jgi:hypothetical protein
MASLSNTAPLADRPPEPNKAKSLNIFLAILGLFSEVF